MATATVQRRAQIRDVKEYTFLWEGIDRNNRQVRGEMRAASETVVTTNLRRQGIRVAKIKQQTFRGGRQRQREGHHVLHPPARDDAARPACRCCRRSTSSPAATATPASRA